MGPVPGLQPFQADSRKAGRGRELEPGLFLVGKQPTHPPKTAYGIPPSLVASSIEETWGMGSRDSVHGEQPPRSG